MSENMWSEQASVFQLRAEAAERGCLSLRAELDTARADLEKAHEEIKRLSIEALKAGNRAHNELAETQRDLEKARAEGARLREALKKQVTWLKIASALGVGGSALALASARAALSETP